MWKARDTCLDRLVAIKTSHQQFSRGYRIMTVPYTVRDGVLVPDKPRLWTEIPGGNMPNPFPDEALDIAPDGKRLTALLQPGSTERPQLVFLFTFFDELKRRVPAR